jgi:hypothetical protein
MKTDGCFLFDFISTLTVNSMSVGQTFLSQSGQNVFTPVIVGGIILVSVISGFVIFKVSMTKRKGSK